jgi:hypothetical protein
MTSSFDPENEMTRRGLGKWLESHDGAIRILQILVIPVTLAMLPLTANYLASQREMRSNQVSMFIDVKDKIEKAMLEEGNQTLMIWNQPVMALKQSSILLVETQARTYSSLFKPQERLQLLLFLYEYGLLNHSVADPKTPVGMIGKCYSDEGASLRLYCNLTSTRLTLDGINASNRYLRHLKLHYSYVRNAQFLGANLSGAELMHSNLTGTDFGGANLSKSYFLYADLRRARFDKANLSGTMFECSDLTDAKLSQSHWSELKPPTYNGETHFSNGFQPDKHGWKRSNYRCLDEET